MAQAGPTRTPLSTDPGDEIPVGLQLAWRLRALIVSGRLTAGERLPGVRSLAEWAGVNVNTVRSTYARLEEAGLVESRHGAGTFVSEKAGGSVEIERIAARALAAAEDAGIDARDVAIVALVSSALPQGLDEELPEDPQEPEDAIPELTLEELAAELELDDAWLEADELGARRELRRQIGRLEAQLAGYRRDLESLAEQPRPLHQPEPRIASAEELEGTRDLLLRRLADARNAAAARARRERRAREVRDAILAEPEAHRWEVVSAAETGEDGCATWSASPRLGPLGGLMRWWRVKVSGGCPLPGPRL
jgi:DNA-binding transcriptional regulator YhcF (GntR family)